MLATIVSQVFSVFIFMGCRTIIARYVAKGVSHRYAIVKLSAKRGYRTIWGSANLPYKTSRDIWTIV